MKLLNMTDKGRNIHNLGLSSLILTNNETTFWNEFDNFFFI